MLKIAIIKSDDKKTLSLLEVKGDIHRFKVDKEDAAAAAALAKKIIGFSSSYADREITIDASALSEEFSSRLFLLIDAYCLEKKLVSKYVLKSEEEQVEDQRFVVEGFDKAKAESILSSVSECFPSFSDSVNEPGNRLGPTAWVERIKGEIRAAGIESEVELTEIIADEDSGLGLIHAVGKASVDKPRLLIIKFGVSETYDFCLVGKGVSFDTGGLSLKPAKYMLGMHKDMGGSALMFYSALSSYVATKTPVLCVLHIVENSVDKHAYRVSDVIRSYSGKSVRIVNTDAEGRLILADAVAYASRHLSYKHMVVAATLTGTAKAVAPSDAAVYISDSKAMVEKVSALLDSTGEKGVQLPDSDMYLAEITKVTVANIDNSGLKFDADTAVAHKFIQYFVESRKGRTYTHFDIANYFETETITQSESSLNLLETLSRLVVEKIEVDTTHEK